MKTEHILIAGLLAAGGGYWYYSKKKKELSAKFRPVPSEQPDPEKPGYIPPDCTHLEIYDSTLNFLRNWAFPLPGSKDEFEARVLEAIWAEHPECRGQYPQTLTAKVEGFPETTDSFQEAVDFAWDQFTGGG